MAISDSTTFESFDGNDSTSIPYTLTLQRERDEDIKLRINNVDTTDFTVSPDGIRTGTAIASGNVVTAYRETPKVQDTDYPINTTPAAEDVEQSLDKLTLITQELGAGLRNALTFPLGDDTNHILPLSEDRISKVIGFSEEGVMELTEIGLLNDANALQVARDAAAVSAAAALISELAAAVSAANALTSETNAFNSAISAKGFIWITARDMTDIPTDYPEDQASMMSVDTTGGGGSWDYKGSVLTHVFKLHADAEASYQQIYTPGKNTSGEYTRVRHGEAGGASWTAWGEWTDALSKSAGGTVTGDTAFTGKLTSTNETVFDTTTGEEVVTKRMAEIRSITDNPHYFTNVTPFTSGITATITTDAWTGFKDTILFSSINAGDYAQYEFLPSTYLNALISNQVFLVPLVNELQSSVILRMTMATIASPYGELVSTDEGIQFTFTGNQTAASGYDSVKIAVAYGLTLYETAFIDTPSNFQDNLCVMLEKSGDISIWEWNDLTKELKLFHRETTVQHPWVSGGDPILLTTPTMTITHDGGGASGYIYLAPAYTKNLYYNLQQ